MFLTRLGFGSKMVVTGDVTQVDLPGGTTSGLRVVRDILDGIDDVALLPADQRGRRTPPAGQRHRRRLRAVRRREQPTAPTVRAGRARRPAVSIDVANESRRRRRREPARRAGPARARPAWASTRWPSCRCCSSTCDAMTELHVQWMDEPGPTDVLAFPMDELQRRAATTAQTTPEPGAARRRRALPRRSRARQAQTAGHSDRGRARTCCCTHGVLHLLGFDHAEPEEHAEMFGLQARAARRPGATPRRRRRADGQRHDHRRRLARSLVAALLVPSPACSSRRRGGAGPGLPGRGRGDGRGRASGAPPSCCAVLARPRRDTSTCCCCCRHDLRARPPSRSSTVVCVDSLSGERSWRRAVAVAA